MQQLHLEQITTWYTTLNFHWMRRQLQLYLLWDLQLSLPLQFLFFYNSLYFLLTHIHSLSYKRQYLFLLFQFHLLFFIYMQQSRLDILSRYMVYHLQLQHHHLLVLLINNRLHIFTSMYHINLLNWEGLQHHLLIQELYIQHLIHIFCIMQSHSLPYSQQSLLNHFHNLHHMIQDLYIYYQQMSYQYYNRLLQQQQYPIYLLRPYTLMPTYIFNIYVVYYLLHCLLHQVVQCLHHQHKFLYMYLIILLILVVHHHFSHSLLYIYAFHFYTLYNICYRYFQYNTHLCN